MRRGFLILVLILLWLLIGHLAGQGTEKRRSSNDTFCACGGWGNRDHDY